MRDRKDEVLFIDLRTWNKNITTYKLDKKTKKKKVIFDDDQINDVRNIYFAFQDEDESLYKDVPELCRKVEKKEIVSNNYSLVPSKYIEFVDHDMKINYDKEMKKIQKEMAQILSDDVEINKKLKQAFKNLDYQI